MYCKPTIVTIIYYVREIILQIHKIAMVLFVCKLFYNYIKSKKIFIYLIYPLYSGLKRITPLSILKEQSMTSERRMQNGVKLWEKHLFV